MLHLAQEHIKSCVYTAFCRQTQAWFDHTPSQPGNMWLHQYSAKPQRICPDEKNFVWEQSELRASVCLPAKMCGHKRLKFSGNLHRVFCLTFSIYMAGSYSKKNSSHKPIIFSKILFYNDKGCFHEKLWELEQQAPALWDLSQQDSEMRAICNIQPQFKAVGRIRAFETLCPVALNYLHAEALHMFWKQMLFSDVQVVFQVGFWKISNK